MNISELKLAIALPSYDGRRHNALALMALARRMPHAIPLDSRGSLLAHIFNKTLVAAHNLAKAGKVTHMLMLHDDIIPCDDNWMDNLWGAYITSGAQLISAVVPIKSGKGTTSTAVEGPTPWNPRRLTLKEIHREAPTFTKPGLLLNTGMMLFDLREDWVNGCYFKIEDDVVVDPVSGELVPRVASEDWNFTRMARERGCERIYATRAVQLYHVGNQMFPNFQNYGIETDDGTNG